MITGECDANPLNMSPGRPRHIDTQLSPSVSEPGHRPHSPHIPDPTWLALNYFKWQHELFVPQSILSTEYTFLIKGFLICFTAFDKRIKILKLVFSRAPPGWVWSKCQMWGMQFIKNWKIPIKVKQRLSSHTTTLHLVESECSWDSIKVLKTNCPILSGRREGETDCVSNKITCDGEETAERGSLTLHC